jgi:heat shock protein HtpX
MWNLLKTTALLGAMTGLMLVLGAVTGGGLSGDWIGAVAGMFLMLIVATVMNFGTFFIADTLVIKSTGAVPVPAGELQWLHEDLAEVSKKAGIPTPRLYMTSNPSPNAFATGRSPKKGVVAVTGGLLRVLGRREIKGVVAHEVGHIKNRDTLVSAIAATLAGVITFMAFAVRFASGRRMNPLVGIAIMICAPMAAVVLRMMISRTREYGADRRAAQLTGDPEGLALALEGLRRGIQQTPMQGDAARNVHHFANGFTGGIARLMSTHPPAEKRVAALRKMAAKQG